MVRPEEEFTRDFIQLMHVWKGTIRRAKQKVRKHDVQRGTDKSTLCSVQRRQIGCSRAAIVYVQRCGKEEGAFCSPLCFL